MKLKEEIRNQEGGLMTPKPVKPRIRSKTPKPTVKKSTFELQKAKSQDLPIDSVPLSYLKKSLLQFFLQDEQSQKLMIPIILSLVGCDEDQKQAAVRQWIENRQLINRTHFWPFK